MEDWADLEPRFVWRHSQRHLLDLAGRVTDSRWHLCAPPGAGKTLIGLELARQVARPTLVLSPTTAIRDQWAVSTAMFGANPAGFATSVVDDDAPLLSVTYQLLGNPGTASVELAAAARRLWVADVAADFDDAPGRVRAVESSDPRRARRELGSRVRRIRRSLASPGADGGVTFAELVGPRARDLIDALVARGIGCVVLDECHHLLDWWALVTTALVDELAAHGEVAVVGLTATLPDPEVSREAENYLRLLGPVDAELQLPAMVAEGGIAPWCDGVRVVPPTAPEVAFIDEHASHLTRDLDGVLSSEEFVEWVVGRLLEPALSERATAAPGWQASRVADFDAVTAGGWSSFWDRDPLAAVACAGWWEARGLALPAGFEPPSDVGPFSLRDRLVLADAWLHDPDHTCPPHCRGELGTLLRRYGYAITSTGVRGTRSPADLVCARSSAKGEAAAAVLAGEVARRGDGMRALVVVEHDRATTPPAAARQILGEDAGTVGRALAALCANRDVLEAGVAAVTARGMWVDAVVCDAALAQLNVTVGPVRSVSATGSEIARAVRLVGSGPTWTAAQWLAAAEHVLEAGLVHTLIATRGLVGEGWDCPALNVLVDCSEAASSTAVTQLRGRVLRRFTEEPGKVASIWDVTVAHESATGDWDRLRRRHEQWWGPTVGGVVRGPAKVHARLDDSTPPNGEEMAMLNAASVAKVADVAATLNAWASVDPGGAPAPALLVRARQRQRVRVRARSWRPGVAAAAIVASSSALAATVVSPLFLLAGLVGLGAAGAITAGRSRDSVEAALVVAEAVRDGLHAAGAADVAALDVTARRGVGTVELTTSLASPDVTVWADAVAEVLGPLATPRWMVVAPSGAAWRVPAAVGATRAAVEAYAAAFVPRFPGARMVRAGTPAATVAVLRARRSRPDAVEVRERWLSSSAPRIDS